MTRCPKCRLWLKRLSDAEVCLECRRREIVRGEPHLTLGQKAAMDRVIAELVQRLT